MKALQLQEEEKLPQWRPLDKNLPHKSPQRDYLTPDQKEYKTKASIHRLGSMFVESEDEI